jgi:hypothetical protein
MSDLVIEQALYGSQGAGGYRFLARSPGFHDDWLPEAERLCTGFGDRPAGVACPACVFAQPFGKYHVAIVQAADQGTDDAGRPGALGFHLLVLHVADYRKLGGDPFRVAERFPPPWHTRGELPALSWPAEPLPPRTVQEVDQILREANRTATFLGSAQVLVDGGRLVFERPAPDPELVRKLWKLLPTSTRCERWPATFAFGNALGFDVLVVPRANGEEYAGYITEERAGDYPPGRYELNLQIAAEAGDQQGLDKLFARRSPTETLRLGLIVLAVVVVLAVVAGLLNPRRPKEPPPAPQPAPPPVPRLDLPAAERNRSLDKEESQRLARQLLELANQLGVPPPDVTQPQPAFVAVLGAAPEAGWPATLPWAALFRNNQPSSALEIALLLEALDQKLGTPDPQRDPGPLWTFGSLRWQLRVLLWKHAVAPYNAPSLNPVELVEKLQAKVVPQGTP